MIVKEAIHENLFINFWDIRIWFILYESYSMVHIIWSKSTFDYRWNGIDPLSIWSNTYLCFRFSWLVRRSKLGFCHVNRFLHKIEWIKKNPEYIPFLSDKNWLTVRFGPYRSVLMIRVEMYRYRVVELWSVKNGSCSLSFIYMNYTLLLKEPFLGYTSERLQSVNCRWPHPIISSI